MVFLLVNNAVIIQPRFESFLSFRYFFRFWYFIWSNEKVINNIENNRSYVAIDADA